MLNFEQTTSFVDELLQHSWAISLYQDMTLNISRCDPHCIKVNPKDRAQGTITLLCLFNVRGQRAWLGFVLACYFDKRETII